MKTRLGGERSFRRFALITFRYHDHFIIASGYSDRYCVIYR